MIRALCALLLLASQADADAIIAARTLRAQELISLEDLVLAKVTISGGTTDFDLLVGRETRHAIYAGRPVRLEDVRAPALVERNQIVPLIYNSGGVLITTDGRALERAAEGERIRVMNLASRSTVVATILSDGSAQVR